MYPALRLLWHSFWGVTETHIEWISVGWVWGKTWLLFCGWFKSPDYCTWSKNSSATVNVAMQWLDIFRHDVSFLFLQHLIDSLTMCFSFITSLFLPLSVCAPLSLQSWWNRSTEMSWTFLQDPLCPCPWHMLPVWCAPSCLLLSRATHRTTFCPAPLTAWPRAPDLACYPCRPPAPPWAPRPSSTCLTSRAAVCTTPLLTATWRSIRALLLLPFLLLPGPPTSLCSTATATVIACPSTASPAFLLRATRGCPSSTATQYHTQWAWEWCTLPPLAPRHQPPPLQPPTLLLGLPRTSNRCSPRHPHTSTHLEAITAPQIPARYPLPVVTPLWGSTPPNCRGLWAITQ